MGTQVQVRPAEYFCWHAMLTRCTKERHPSYRDYGARGIKVCGRWRSFKTFLADMGPRPSAEHSLDRVDPKGNYEPGNVRWATRNEQARNNSRTYKVIIDGQQLTLTECAQRLGLHPSTLSQRLRAGWSLERATTTPRSAVAR